LKVLILGGYGVFGGRLVGLLADCVDLELLICGRSLTKASRFCADHHGQARLRPMQLDRGQVKASLMAERPDVVVDASGPFQSYGGERYGVIEACIALRINYLDFADAADFVFGVTRFDAAAKAAGIFVLSGVSSFPVLTAAVLREMAKTMDVIQVEGGIAPSPYAGIGLNVMRAVVGYAGEPVKLIRNGKHATGVGLAESRRFTIAVPGRMPLRNIRFSLVDVPDLQVIPPEHPALADIWMGAGPVPEILHRMLNLLATARSVFRLPSLVPLAGFFYHVLNLMKFGEHRGGMYVRARGVRDGAEAMQSWHLLAEGDDGPLIPSMAIEAILRSCLDGASPLPGARPATGVLELADYEQMFKTRAIWSSMRKDPPSGNLYEQVLDTAFDSLPGQVKALHSGTETRTWFGRAQVVRGRGVLARPICRVMGFPQEGKNVPVTVVLSPTKDGERWTRTFDAITFSSFQERGTGRNAHLLIERFGFIKVAIALVLDRDRLHFVPRKWWCLGLPLPKSLLPRSHSFETETDGQFKFDVQVSVPFFGLIVSYAGGLEPSNPVSPQGCPPRPLLRT
jgi:hypothetical protein